MPVLVLAALGIAQGGNTWTTPSVTHATVSTQSFSWMGRLCFSHNYSTQIHQLSGGNAKTNRWLPYLGCWQFIFLLLNGRGRSCWCEVAQTGPVLWKPRPSSSDSGTKCALTHCCSQNILQTWTTHLFLTHLAKCIYFFSLSVFKEQNGGIAGRGKDLGFLIITKCN